MWIARFKIKHNCLLGNKCEKFKITLQSMNLTTFKRGRRDLSYSIHYMSGNDKDMNAFIKELGSDDNVVTIERKGNMFFLLEKSSNKIVKFYNPKLVFIKPVVIGTDGYETWEIGSWNQRDVSVFLTKIRKTIKNFMLIKMVKTKATDIFFPKIMPELTSKQKNALEIAIKNGYYKTPRETSVRKLAKGMGVSLSTYQQHLRRAEEKIIPDVLYYAK